MDWAGGEPDLQPRSNPILGQGVTFDGASDEAPDADAASASAEALGSQREVYVTFNTKGIWLWHRNQLQLSLIVRDPEKAIMNVLWLPKLRVYLVGCIDMQFRIYDRGLSLVQEVEPATHCPLPPAIIPHIIPALTLCFPTLTSSILDP